MRSKYTEKNGRVEGRLTILYVSRRVCNIKDYMDGKVAGLHYGSILQQIVKMALKTRRADSRIT